VYAQWKITRLLCYRIAKILAFSWAIAVANTTAFKPDKNVTLSADRTLAQ